MKKKLYFIVILFLVFLFSWGNVHAASIFSAADKNNITENQTFTVSVYTDTQGVNINAIEGLITFPKDLLRVESVNNNGSIFSIWTEQPTFSNTNGAISFNGGVPAPGYIGTKGKVMSILFKAEKPGTAQINFSSAGIYANDGVGTNVISDKNGITINIAPQKKVEKQIGIPMEVPSAVLPVIESPVVTPIVETPIEVPQMKIPSEESTLIRIDFVITKTDAIIAFLLLLVVILSSTTFYFWYKVKLLKKSKKEIQKIKK